MNTTHRLGLAVPLVGLTGLTFGVALIGAQGLWNEYTATERALTVLMCVLAAVGLGISVSIAFDRRIRDIPWGRIVVIAVMLMLSIAVAIARRSIVLDGL